MKQTKGVTYDDERFSINVAKIKKGGEYFEIVIDPDLAVKFKEGEDDSIKIKDFVMSEKIFSNATKGQLASETEMKAIFGTDDFNTVAQKIVNDGEIQLTADYRKKIREAKTRNVITLIQRNAIDPKTKNPIPVNRIELAMEEAKVKIDELRTAEDQVKEIVKKLQVVMPLKFEVVLAKVHIPVTHAPKVRGTLTKYGTIKEENWNNDGSLDATVEIPGGLKGDFSEELGSVTHGCAAIEFND